MAPPASVLSKTLHSISLTKIREIEKQRDKYEVRKSEVLAAAAKHPSDIRKWITELLRGVTDLYPEAMDDRRVKNICCWLQQSNYDPSIPCGILQSSENVLRSKFEVQSCKLGLAQLYSRLVTEWMNSTTPIDETSIPDEASFEVVERQKERLQELCDKFEKVVFEPLEVGEVGIVLYMNDLFKGVAGTKEIEVLRMRIQYDADFLLSNKTPFNESMLKWCIKGLLVEDLLSDDKQAILRDFLDNTIVLREIADVLNLRFADFESWGWQAGDEGIPVLPRQQLNGKYRIWMDEDVLQAIFIHYVGASCCISLKGILDYFIASKDETPTPPASEPDLDEDVKEVLKQLSMNLQDPSPKLREARWVLQMYGDELRERCGGLRLIEKKFLPLGMLSMMRRKAVRWNLVL